MDETYRMLGREHEADLEREALKWRRAAEVRQPRREIRRAARGRLKTRMHGLLVRLTPPERWRKRRVRNA
jgi:hypothetical protein